MNRNYPPDADAQDVFGLDGEILDMILDAEDPLEEGAEHGMTYEQVEDLLEWFGRTI